MAVAYAVVSWLLIQIATQVFPFFEIPNWCGDLMKLPNGPTPGTLRVEPEWDPLRGDPRFEKLANAGA